MNISHLLSISAALVIGGLSGWFVKGSVSNQGAKLDSVSQKTSRGVDGQFLDSNGELGKSKRDEVGYRDGESGIQSLGLQLRGISDPIERGKIFDQLISQLTKENALEMRDLFKDMDSRSDEFRDFHYAWGQVSGEEAAFFGLSSKEYDGGHIFKGWASANPEAAQAWFNGLDYDSDPNFDVLKKRGVSEARVLAFLHENLVEGLYHNDPTAAANYISTLSDDQARFARNTSEGLVEEIISLNGIEAAKDWISLLPEGNISSDAIGEIADEWSERDPEAALAWAQEHENTEVRQEALYNVWRNMASGQGGADPFVAAEQINAMPESVDKDYALSGYASGARWRYPETAADAALSINDPDIREDALLSSASYYLRREPNNAKEWLANSGLSDDLIEQINRSSRRRR